jgi:tetratricopeptide (TPR) repeat protein
MSCRGLFLMKKLILSLLLVGFSFAATNEDLKQILAIIQGTFKDKVYTITIEKSKEYLLKAPENDPYRNDVLKILAYSYVETGNINELLNLIKYVEKTNVPDDTKVYIYKLAVSKLPDDDEKVALLLKLYSLEKNEDYLITAANILYDKKEWDKILNLPNSPKINHLKVYALYKLKKYKDLINFANSNNFDSKNLDFVYYYKGMAYLKLNDRKNAAISFEEIKDKNPEIQKFLADFYFKNKDYKNAEKYLKSLLSENKEKAYALFYLGMIMENQKKYESALDYYKKVLSENDKEYKVVATQRILQLKAKNLVPKENYYSIRVVLYLKQETAVNYIKKHKLEECFLYPFKHFYGVYCGLYLDKNTAKEDLKQLKKELKVKDMLVDKISI